MQCLESRFSYYAAGRIGRVTFAAFIYGDHPELIFFAFGQIGYRGRGLVPRHFGGFVPLAMFVFLLNDILFDRGAVLVDRFFPFKVDVIYKFKKLKNTALNKFCKIKLFLTLIPIHNLRFARFVRSIVGIFGQSSTFSGQRIRFALFIDRFNPKLVLMTGLQILGHVIGTRYSTARYPTAGRLVHLLHFVVFDGHAAVVVGRLPFQGHTMVKFSDINIPSTSTSVSATSLPEAFVAITFFDGSDGSPGPAIFTAQPPSDSGAFHSNSTRSLSQSTTSGWPALPGSSRKNTKSELSSPPKSSGGCHSRTQLSS
uniref:Uncharacterized protein n=1 Tax=Romanomermis culicivorax TaxID=13658 RepID=A0A915KJE6_ROMCU